VLTPRSACLCHLAATCHYADSVGRGCAPAC
jgi:hypothetical protein